MPITRRSFLGSLAVAPFAFRALAQGPLEYRLYIGAYTIEDNHPTGSRGIYSAEWDATAGTLTKPSLVAKTTNPSWLTLNARHTVLYAVNEEEPVGYVVPYFIDRGSGKLSGGQALFSGGADPCQIAIDQTGRALFVNNYTSGTLTTFLIGDEGELTSTFTLHFSGHGPNAKRQEGSHPHCVLISPDNEFLLVNDLGTDRIIIFRYDHATAELTSNPAQPFYVAAPGSGPRHSLFHPTGKWLYCLNELSSTIDHLAWASSGTLKHLATANLLPPDFPATSNNAAELVIDRAGQFLYASNRGHDSIVTFAIDYHTGTLTLVERTPCGGRDPRHFALDPTENWLLVANHHSNTITFFERDRTTGKLTPTNRSIKAAQPVCLMFS